MSQENVEIVRNLQQLFETGAKRGDFTAARGSGFISDDFEFLPAPEYQAQETYRRHQEFAEFMRSWTEDFERWSTRVERLIDAPDDRVVGFMHQSGIGKAIGATVALHYGL